MTAASRTEGDDPALCMNLPMFGGRATLQLWLRGHMTENEFRLMLDALEGIAPVVVGSDGDDTSRSESGEVDDART